MGGIYYYISIIKAISYLPINKQPKIYLFFSPEYESFIKDLDFPFLSKVKLDYSSHKDILKKFLFSVIKGKNLFYEPISKKFELDGIYAINDYPIKEKINSNLIVAAWIPDLQHAFFPEFFEKKRLFLRKLRISFLIKNASNLIVSSNDVKKHFVENYSIPESLKIHTVRFSSINDPVEFGREILQKYEINRPYFIVCNQFLKHKNHLVILKALKELKVDFPEILVIITGNTSVYGNNDFFGYLESFIKENYLFPNLIITGLIPRNEQLALIKYAQALIQPSKFEGWSTSIEDAKSLNVPVIASDISIHREQLNLGISFFKPDDFVELASQLKNFQAEKYAYNLNYNENIIKFAYDFLDVFEKNSTKASENVLHINASFNSGSTGQITKSIADLASLHGYSNFIAFGRGDTNRKSKNVFRTNNLLDAYLHGLKSILFDRHGFGSYISTKFFIFKIKKIKPKIVHLHNLHGYYIHIGVLFSYLKKNDIKVVWTQHDCWAFTGHCAHYEDISCLKWTTHCQACPKKEKYPRSILMDNSYINYNDKKKIFNSIKNMTIVAPSYWLQNQLNRSFLKENSILTINNGIDLSLFKPLSSNELVDFEISQNLEGYNVVLGVANIWTTAKGIHDIVKISELLPENYKIVLIGLIDDSKFKLPKNVIKIPRTKNLAELVKWYSFAKVFINPTYMDTFPTTNIEAIACGTPVITYNSGGSPEATDANTGYVHQKGDILNFKESIVTVVESGKSKYIAECRDRAIAHFDQNLQFLKYVNLYKELLSK